MSVRESIIVELKLTDPPPWDEVWLSIPQDIINEVHPVKSGSKKGKDIRPQKKQKKAKKKRVQRKKKDIDDKIEFVQPKTPLAHEYVDALGRIRRKK